MKYNILLLANNTYFKLLQICLKSILSVCDIDKIDKIFVADLGLKSEYLEFLNNIDSKVEIIDTKVRTGNSKKIFSREWIESVSQKTFILRMLVENNNLPIVMIDSDTLVINDFSNVINTKYDVQICKRATPLLRKDNFLLEYIASFFVVNNTKAITFITDWINRLEERIKLDLAPPHETPALIETFNNNTDLDIGMLDENEISCENNYINGFTKIIHAKSRNTGDKISLYRFTNIKNLPYFNFLNLLPNNKEKILFSFMYVIKRLFPVHAIKQLIKKIIKRS